MEILNKNGNFPEKSKFWTKRATFKKNRNFKKQNVTLWQKSNFLFEHLLFNRNLNTNWNVEQKSKFRTKVENLGKHRNWILEKILKTHFSRSRSFSGNDSIRISGLAHELRTVSIFIVEFFWRSFRNDSTAPGWCEKYDSYEVLKSLIFWKKKCLRQK